MCVNAWECLIVRGCVGLYFEWWGVPECLILQLKRSMGIGQIKIFLTICNKAFGKKTQGNRDLNAFKIILRNFLSHTHTLFRSQRKLQVYLIFHVSQLCIKIYLKWHHKTDFGDRRFHRTQGPCPKWISGLFVDWSVQWVITQLFILYLIYINYKLN